MTDCPCGDDGCRVHMPPVEYDEGPGPYPTDCGRGAEWADIFENPRLQCFGYRPIFFYEPPLGTWYTIYETIFSEHSLAEDDEIRQCTLIERTTSKNIHFVSDPYTKGNKWILETKIDGR